MFNDLKTLASSEASLKTDLQRSQEAVEELEAHSIKLSD